MPRRLNLVRMIESALCGANGVLKRLDSRGWRSGILRTIGSRAFAEHLFHRRDDPFLDQSLPERFMVAMRQESKDHRQMIGKLRCTVVVVLTVMFVQCDQKVTALVGLPKKVVPDIDFEQWIEVEGVGVDLPPVVKVVVVHECVERCQFISSSRNCRLAPGAGRLHGSG